MVFLTFFGLALNLKMFISAKFRVFNRVLNSNCLYFVLTLISTKEELVIRAKLLSEIRSDIKIFTFQCLQFVVNRSCIAHVSFFMENAILTFWQIWVTQVLIFMNSSRKEIYSLKVSAKLELDHQNHADFCTKWLIGPSKKSKDVEFSSCGKVGQGNWTSITFWSQIDKW